MDTDDMAEDETCPNCGTDHDGYPSGSLGATTRCLRRQAADVGAVHDEAALDQLDAHLAERRTRAYDATEATDADQ